MIKHLSLFCAPFCMAGLLASAAAAFSVTSPDIVGGKLAQAQFADSFGCSGGNISPALDWVEAPKGTKSFVVTVYDPDAPTGSGWWHWTVANIPATAQGLARGAGNAGGVLPEGAVMTATDAGAPGFLGACPPEGTVHQYVFTVKALSVEKLDLPPNATPALLGFMANMNLLGEASVTAMGGR